MPYSKWFDVNPAIRGIKPKVTLSQANMIADWADKIEGVESPWAVAIAQFKKSYKVVGGKWVKRVKEVDMSELLELEEAATKKMGGRTHKAGDFLVVEDPESPDTWHLPVKVDGKPDRKLAGQAWAALFSPEGFRGNPYGGPKKAEAKRKLKALYKAQDWDEPTAEAFAECGPTEDDIMYPWVPFGVTSFADLMAYEEANEAVKEMRMRSSQLARLVDRIIDNPEIPDRAAALERVFAEFVDLIRVKLGDLDLEEVERFAESAHPLAVLDVEIVEAERTTRAPLRMDIAIIEPGWGNKKDAHYYGRDMLHEHAPVFEGVKMYATDHRPEEKSVRTEVGVIERVVGFTETGAPIGRTLIFDPSFAEATRNRAKEGRLDTLEVSILASGKAREGEIDGKKAKIVESITSAESVDFVTRAGAGGRALNLVENETGHADDGGESVKDHDQETPQEETNQVSESEEVTLAEQDTEAVVEDAAIVPEQARLSEADAERILSEADLPDGLREALAIPSYSDEGELNEAIAKAKDTIRQAVRPGKPFGQGAAHSPVDELKERRQKEEAGWDWYNDAKQRVGGRPVQVPGR